MFTLAVLFSIPQIKPSANPPPAGKDQQNSPAAGASRSTSKMAVVVDGTTSVPPAVDEISLDAETLRVWLEEADRLRVALDTSLHEEKETGEIMYPLLESAPAAQANVKMGLQEYQLPRYIHDNNNNVKDNEAPTPAAGSSGSGMKSMPIAPITGSTIMSPKGLLVNNASLSPKSSTSRSLTSPKASSSSKSLRVSVAEGRQGSNNTMVSSSPKSSSPKRWKRRNDGSGNEDQGPSSRARLDQFLEKLTAANVLTKDDLQHFHAPLPLKPSDEMEDKMRDILERHLGKGQWQDIVASVLAKPLDPMLVYCDESAQMGMSTVGPQIPDEILSAPPTASSNWGSSRGAPTTSNSLGTSSSSSSGSGGRPLTSTTNSRPVTSMGGSRPPSVQGIRVEDSLTATMPILETLPEIEYLHRLGASLRQEGRDEEAVECFHKAASMLEKPVPIKPQDVALFPFTHEVFRAARCIQHMARARRRRRIHACVLVQAAFRGYLVRRTENLWKAKKLAASKIIQRQYRHHVKVLTRCAISIQKVSTFNYDSREHISVA